MRLDNIKIITCDDGKVIENGYIEYDNGIITDIGPSSEAPSGNILYPGFIDAHTHIGLLEDSLSVEGDDVNESSDPVTASLKVIDGINPFDRSFKEACAAGVVIAAVAPGSSNPVGGNISVIKTHGVSVDNMLVSRDCAVKFALGENPKHSFGSNNDAPVTRMSIASLIRDALNKAKIYKIKYDNYKSSGDVSDIPDYDSDSEALIKLLDGTATAHFHAHRADDICTAIRIAEEFNLDYRIVHCTEGYLIKDILKEKNVKCLVGPNLSDRSKPELSNQSFKNPGILSNSGVEVSIITDHPVTTLNYLPLCAALAVKNGMDKEKALEAITVEPAKTLKIDSRYGSIKIGKSASFTLYNGDVFELMSDCLMTVIDGETCFNK